MARPPRVLPFFGLGAPRAIPPRPPSFGRRALRLGLAAISFCSALLCARSSFDFAVLDLALPFLHFLGICSNRVGMAPSQAKKPGKPKSPLALAHAKLFDMISDNLQYSINVVIHLDKIDTFCTYMTTHGTEREKIRKDLFALLNFKGSNKQAKANSILGFAKTNATLYWPPLPTPLPPPGPRLDFPRRRRPTPPRARAPTRLPSLIVPSFRTLGIQNPFSLLITRLWLNIQ